MKLSKSPIPESYGLIKQGRTSVLLSKPYLKQMIQLGVAHPDRLFDMAPRMGDGCSGRGAIKVLSLPGQAGERLVIRRYHRGGSLARFVSDLYWGDSRPFQELWLTCMAREKGIATVDVVAACHTTVFWRLHRGHLISREIKGGKDASRYLESRGKVSTSEQIREKRDTIAAIGSLIRTMHDVGIYHADLNLKNIMVQQSEAEPQRIYLIDFDKSTILDHLSERKRCRNLMRLYRSVEKFKARGLPLTRTDALRFLCAYYRQDARSMRTLLRTLNQEYLRHIALHRLGSRILNLFS